VFFDIVFSLIFGRFWSSFGRSWAPLGESERGKKGFPKRVRRKTRFLVALGRILGEFWVGFGRVWERLGHFLGAPGAFPGSLGRPLGDFKVSGMVFGMVSYLSQH